MMRFSRLERSLLAVVIGSGLLRLVDAGLMALGDDEGYYWLWSRHLAWSYPDHPGMLGAVVALSTRLFGDGAFGIRALNVVLASLTPWLVYVAGRRIFDRDTGARAGLLMAALPALGIGTILVSPDVPMGFFWALSLWMGWEALDRGGRWWVGAGAMIGLALLSKITSLGLILGLAGTVLTGGRLRQVLRDRWVYAGALVTIALFAPVVAWNLEHQWVLFEIKRRGLWLVPRSIPENLLFFAGGQMLYFGLLAPLMITACVVAVRRAKEPAWRYLAWMSLPVLVVMTAGAIESVTKPHWPAPAYFAAAIALGALWPQWVRARPRVVWASAAVTAGLTAALSLALLLPWVRIQVEVGIGLYDRVAEAAARQAAVQPASTVIITDRYQAASHIAYRLRERFPVTTFYGAFLIWQRPREWAGWRGVYVEDDPKQPGLDIRAMCRNVRQVDTAELAPGQANRRPVRIFVCDDLRFP